MSWILATAAKFSEAMTAQGDFSHAGSDIWSTQESAQEKSDGSGTVLEPCPFDIRVSEGMDKRARFLVDTTKRYPV